MTALPLGVVRRSLALTTSVFLTLFGAVREPVAAQLTGIVADVGVRGGASVRWDAVAGATGYFVVRWNIGDATCCKRISAPNVPAAMLSWADELPQGGTYAYRVYATTSTSTYVGEVRMTFEPGKTSSSTGYVAPAGSGSIQQTTSGSPVISTAIEPTTLILKPAGPASLTTRSLVPDGVGVLLTWTLVPNAVSYRIYRTVAGSGQQGTVIDWLDRGPLAPRGSARGIDLDAITPTTEYSYWVEAVLAGGVATAPSPVSVVSSPPFFYAVSNLRATVGGTTSIVMPAPLSVRGAVPGSQVTWEWDAFPAIYRYEFSYELVGGDPQFGPVVERAIVPTVGEPPRFTPVTRSIPQGKSVKFCVATYPQGGDPNQPLAEWELFGRPLPFGPVRCITTQAP